MKGIIETPRRKRRLRRHERGLQLVEASIVMPIFLVLFAVTAEMGRMYYNYTALAKGTRLAARFLTTAPLNTVDNRTKYGNQAKYLVVYGTTTPASNAKPIIAGLTTNNVIITQYGGIPASIPEYVKVEISGVTHKQLFDLGGLINNDSFSLNIPLAPSVTMRYLLTQPLN